MQYNVTISREGRTLWTGLARNHHDALEGYRLAIGKDATDYDAVDPKWFYRLDFHFGAKHLEGYAA